MRQPEHEEFLYTCSKAQLFVLKVASDQFFDRGRTTNKISVSDLPTINMGQHGTTTKNVKTQNKGAYLPIFRSKGSLT
jgi:hypothetical protein